MDALISKNILIDINIINIFFFVSSDVQMAIEMGIPPGDIEQVVRKATFNNFKIVKFYETQTLSNNSYPLKFLTTP